ncbi:PQQ-binding-like beta-propeller repeat protein [Flavobacterium sp.]|uniref:outer membrane protein assembly factor BamB family protein n=1 Tax=Flavobacterium sp. TaxID=239 RepID=UPI002C31D932|nr:hypothetical protein [Flavobacterium sp.]HSD06087.1 hypothetical protein [Flavobacterium sp.]
MRIKTALFLFLFSIASFAQTEFFKSKLLLSGDDLTDFYSSISIDSNQVYFNANDKYIYAHDKKTGILNWAYYSGAKLDNAPKPYRNNVFFGTGVGTWEQLNTKTGELVRIIRVNEVSTQPFIKDTIMYCAAVSPRMGGAILAYDLKNSSRVWQKYIGNGVALQPYFFKDKIVANFDDNYWFELDYEGNVLDKDTLCYSKSFEPPLEENYCNIHYDILNQYNKGVAVKNVSTGNTKYYYGNEMTVILENDKIKIINNQNKITNEIYISNILKLPETKINDYREILKIEGNRIWFFFENTLVVYDVGKNIIVRTYNLNSWKPHQVLLDGTNLWVISKDTGDLVGLKL